MLSQYISPSNLEEHANTSQRSMIGIKLIGSYSRDPCYITQACIEWALSGKGINGKSKIISSFRNSVI